MIDRKEFLLQTIIQAYIQNLEPIGSTQLKSMYDISCSTATIRGYFKKLGEEGYLLQEHISSGRTPTSEALKEYWSKRLNKKISNLKLEAIEYYALRADLSVFIKKENNGLLQEVSNLNDKYILLDFGTFALNLKFSSALYRFLKDLIGLDLNFLQDVATQVGANELRLELLAYLQTQNTIKYNLKEFMKLALKFDFNDSHIEQFLAGEILDNCSEGIHCESILPSGYMGVCNSCQIEGIEAKMLVVGELSKDYEYFYQGVVA